MSRNNQILRFLRGLIKFGSAQYVQCEGRYVIGAPKLISLPADQVKTLVSKGIVHLHNRSVFPIPETTTWIRRHLVQSDTPFAEQHRQTERNADGLSINKSESPLARLATGKTHFLLPHQFAAGERFRSLFQRAALRVRTTMSYQPDPVARKNQGTGVGADLSDMNIDARRQIDAIYTRLPADCTGVIIDACGFEKGLQQIESERGWPRRSAKLVLRIGLDQLAAYFGLMPDAVGEVSKNASLWRDKEARPMSLDLSK